MAINRDDRWLSDAIGNALSGATVYYCTQPATTSSLPPSPLATVYSDTSGDAGTNPVTTDGFGHSVAYLNNSQLYTVVLSHPLFGSNPVVLTDQAIGGTSGGSSSSQIPFSGTPAGTVNGTNKTFTLTNNGTAIPSSGITLTQLIVWLNLPLVQGLGYSVSGNQITYANAPKAASGGVPADAIYATGFYTT